MHRNALKISRMPPGATMHTCNLSTLDVEAGLLLVRGLPDYLHSVLKVSLNHRAIFYLKKYTNSTQWLQLVTKCFN